MDSADLPDIVFGSSVGPFLQTLHPDLRFAVCIAMMKVLAQARQGHGTDPDMLRALTSMEILIQPHFPSNSMPKPAKVSYEFPE